MSNDTTNLTIQQNGGFTRVTHSDSSGQPASSPLSIPHEPSKVIGGATRLDMHTGQIQQGGTTRYNAGQDAQTSSVAATLQRVNGVDTVELVPGVPGSRTNIRTALADGLIEAVGPGLWRDKGSKPEGEADKPIQAADLETEEKAPELDPAWDAKAEEEWSKALAPLPQHSFDAAAASVTRAVMTGADNLNEAATNLAKSAGIPEELASNYVNTGAAYYRDIVEHAVAPMGIGAESKEDFFSWVRTQKSSSVLQNAIQELVAVRNVNPWRTLAAEYMRYTSPQAVAMRERSR